LPARQVPQPLEDAAAASLASQGYSLLAIARIVQRDYYNARLRRLDLAPEVREAVKALFDEDDELEPEFIGQVIQGEMAQLLASTVAKGEPLPEGIAAQLSPARLQQIESGMKSIRGENAVPVEQTLKTHVDAWLALQERLVAIGELTGARYDVMRHHMQHFLDLAGPTAAVFSIDAALLQKFYELLISKITAGTWSKAYCRDVFSTGRRFVRWSIEQGTIPPLPNIASRFRFGSTTKAIQVWTRDEVRHVFGKASDRMRLYLLLALNIGAMQQDIADLQDDEIDWTEGRVRRKRSKTRDKANAPVVSYLLWPETLRLLEQFRSGKATVLLAETGRPLVRKELREGGKLHASDTIGISFQQLQARLEFRKSFKHLRKTGASLLAEHPIYGRFAQHYLGHAPSTMADKHYIQPPQQLFDDATQWLGQQFGFVSD
jgi:hypothetical protein